MKKFVLTFGLISGLIFAVTMIGGMALCLNGTMSFDNAEIVGYTTMVLAFSLVFFGIRQYRENAGGAITFGRAFKVGILITLVACAVYVVSWEIVYYGFMPDFMEKFSAYTLEKMAAEGASASEIAAERQSMETLGRLYKNPIINIGITFLEAFPVGLIVTLISAAILRRKSAPPSARAATAIA